MESKKTNSKRQWHGWLPYCFGSGWHEPSPICTKQSQPCTASRETLGLNKGVGTLSNDAITLTNAQPNCSSPSSATTWTHSSRPRRFERHPPRFPWAMADYRNFSGANPSKALPTTSSLWRCSFLFVPFASLTSFLWSFSNKVHFSNQ